jgi:hypothetical protein
VRLVTNDAGIAAGLDEVRNLVSADGGDIVLDGVDGTTVKLRLVLETAHCVECVMPRTFLEHVALDVFRRNGATTDAVVIDDPRERPDFVTPDH